MQALSDDQHVAAVEAKVDRLEKKVDDGFAEMRAEFKAVRSEAREDFRELRGEIGALHRLMIQAFSGLGLSMILGFAALLLQHHL
jgi:hypothetical protein